jgi:hypothetical protein
MSFDFEDFSRTHQHTIAALEAISTFAAVVVSLALSMSALRANRTRVKAYASINVILHSTLEGKPRPTYVVVYVRNIGILPVMIPFSFFSWKVSFGRGVWTVNPWDYVQTDEWIAQKKYPFEIKPRGSETFFLAEISEFRRTIREVFAGANFLRRCRFFYIGARVTTDDGKTFIVKIDRRLRKELRALLAAANVRT